MLDSCKMLLKHSEAFHTFLWHFCPSLKLNFIAYRSSKVFSRLDCIFENHQLWQSDFSRGYSNCCCSCSFELESIEFGQSSHKSIKITYWIVKSLRQFKRPVQKESGHLVKAPRRSSPVPLVSLQHYFSSSGNSPRFIGELLFFSFEIFPHQR